MLKMHNFQNTWDKSFKKKQNFLLYPNEHIIRFVNQYIKKRTNLKLPKSQKKCLDIGCGSGRHIIYLHKNGFNVSGIDISKIALQQTKSLIKYSKIKKKIKLNLCSATNINFNSNFFDFLISHGTFDSMPYKDCQKSINESFRILKEKGFFYVDLISDKVKNKGKFINKFDQLISSEHEKNTIQSYFNIKRIKNNFRKFKIIKIYKVSIKENKKLIDERYHCILRKN